MKLNYEDVYVLYKLNSNPIINNPRKVFADPELKSASWMTRTIVKLEECKFPLINKICAIIAKVILYLLPAASKYAIDSFKLRRKEILEFEFEDRQNLFRLIRFIPGIDEDTFATRKILEMRLPGRYVAANYSIGIPSQGGGDVVPYIYYKLSRVEHRIVEANLNGAYLWKVKMESPQGPKKEELLIKDGKITPLFIQIANEFRKNFNGMLGLNSPQLT